MDDSQENIEQEEGQAEKSIIFDCCGQRMIKGLDSAYRCMACGNELHFPVIGKIAFS